MILEYTPGWFNIGYIDSPRPKSMPVTQLTRNAPRTGIDGRPNKKR